MSRDEKDFVPKCVFIQKAVLSRLQGETADTLFMQHPGQRFTVEAQNLPVCTTDAIIH